tara:strand:- start:1375 stop:2016 length:642 start_codon:yes stop_codon:yes gene_type:complete
MKTNSNLRKIEKHRLKQDLLRKKAIKSGVNLIAPETIFLSNDTKFGKNVTINPYVVIGKKVRIGNDVEILPFSHIEGAKIENKVKIGPYARLREGTHLMSGVKIGNFVETKKSTIKKNSKVPHLSYIGDTKVGKNSNIGAGTITCNYDGIKKNQTIISDNVFIGSNSSLVAPIKISNNAVVGAGSVITKDVKENSLAIERSEQEEIENYKRKK